MRRIRRSLQNPTIRFMLIVLAAMIVIFDLFSLAYVTSHVHPLSGEGVVTRKTHRGKRGVFVKLDNGQEIEVIGIWGLLKEGDNIKKLPDTFCYIVNGKRTNALWYYCLQTFFLNLLIFLSLGCILVFAPVNWNPRKPEA